jgi:hypothetical protein
MVAGLVQQRKYQRIFANQRVKRESAIQTNETAATLFKRLRVHCSDAQVYFIFDARKCRSKFGYKSF